ncbi:hypothetical protein GGR56DRAFT_599920 [Xylariaceae sp. FL0804]|nr:hypothetical protein GGR56DRAFT_599920 [Xylariaceae sp. FL0804]
MDEADAGRLLWLRSQREIHSTKVRVSDVWASNGYAPHLAEAQLAGRAEPDLVSYSERQAGVTASPDRPAVCLGHLVLVGSMYRGREALPPGPLAGCDLETPSPHHVRTCGRQMDHNAAGRLVVLSQIGEKAGRGKTTVSGCGARARTSLEGGTSHSHHGHRHRQRPDGDRDSLCGKSWKVDACKTRLVTALRRLLVLAIVPHNQMTGTLGISSGPAPDDSLILQQ